MNVTNMFIPRALRALYVCLLMIPILLTVGFKEAQAQRFTFDLGDIGHLFPDSPLDTIKAPLDRLTLGDGTVENFLTTDFSREREIEEYSIYAPIKLSFRYPNVYRFEFREERDGAYIVLTPRDLSTPGLQINVESVDSLASRIRRQSLDDVWRETIVATINEKQAPADARKGLLNISLPVDLPNAVEAIR